MATENTVAVPLRSPDTVMRLDRLGSFHQTRLSFMRVLLRELESQGWRVRRQRFDIDARGVGTALYQVSGPERVYTLVAFAHDLDPALRSDRVIAEAWDATFTLFDGVPTVADVTRLHAQVPLQEAGRISDSELTLARANRSVRLFEHVVDALARGRQPDMGEIQKTGYLMRTTAVYGSGKFGAVDRRFIRDRRELSRPFQAELLTVYLIRLFTFDLVEHLAHARAPQTAAGLSHECRLALGIGNSTGLGMAPFVVSHPLLVDRWMTARETALARVRSIGAVTPDTVERLRSLLARFLDDTARWHTMHAEQARRVEGLRADLHAALQWDELVRPCDGALNQLYLRAERTLGLEAQEALVSLLIELFPERVDDLSWRMFIDEPRAPPVQGGWTVARLLALIERRYGYALAVDWSAAPAQARFWYTSEEKLEPRLGEREQEPGAELEHPLAIARDVARLHAELAQQPPDLHLGAFLRAHVEWRHVVRRVQQLAGYAYAEIRDNLVAADMQPIDILRCKLSFFGATRFDPRSDRWVRITMFQHAPLPDPHSGLVAAEDDWVYPPSGGLQ